MTLEKRATSNPPEIREAVAGGRTIAGYAVVFNSTAEIGDAWREVVAPGAFTESLGSNDVVALYSHERCRVLGRTSAGTLRLKQDNKGLSYEIDLPDTTDGRDLAVLIERGDVNGMSFGFSVTKQEWDETVSPPKRTIQAVDLREITVTAFPAYDDTTIGLRDLEGARRERRQQNFSAADRRLRMKATLDLRSRGVKREA
jgi:HK97 family phage prohead protease